MRPWSYKIGVLVKRERKQRCLYIEGWPQETQEKADVCKTRGKASGETLGWNLHLPIADSRTVRKMHLFGCWRHCQSPVEFCDDSSLLKSWLPPAWNTVLTQKKTIGWVDTVASLTRTPFAIDSCGVRGNQCFQWSDTGWTSLAPGRQYALE